MFEPNFIVEVFIFFFEKCFCSMCSVFIGNLHNIWMDGAFNGAKYQISISINIGNARFNVVLNFRNACDVVSN